MAGSGICSAGCCGATRDTVGTITWHHPGHIGGTLRFCPETGETLGSKDGQPTVTPMEDARVAQMLAGHALGLISPALVMALSRPDCSVRNLLNSACDRSDWDATLVPEMIVWAREQVAKEAETDGG